MANDPHLAPGQDLRVTQLIACALMAAMVPYAAVAWLAVSQSTVAPTAERMPDNAGILRLALAAISAPTLVAAVAWPALFGRFVPVTEPGARFRTFLLIQYALAESVAIYGLVVALAMKEVMNFAYFALPALAVMVWLFPSRGRFQEFLTAQGATRR